MRLRLLRLSDCAPDRWGRRLIDRVEEHRVEEAGSGAERSFAEADYLLRVRDDLRQGLCASACPAPSNGSRRTVAAFLTCSICRRA